MSAAVRDAVVLGSVAYAAVSSSTPLGWFCLGFVTALLVALPVIGWWAERSLRQVKGH